jgi:hypothetical protein
MKAILKSYQRDPQYDYSMRTVVIFIPETPGDDYIIESLLRKPTILDVYTSAQFQVEKEEVEKEFKKYQGKEKREDREEADSDPCEVEHF